MMHLSKDKSKSIWNSEHGLLASETETNLGRPPAASSDPHSPA
jgi:hypothetical protein